MSRISGGKKGTPPTQAVPGLLGQYGTRSGSLRQDTMSGGGPCEPLVQTLAADKAGTHPRAPNRRSQFPAGSRVLGTPCQDK